MSGGRRLVLASGSPRRSELLATLGIRFEVRPVDIDESPLQGESPRAMVQRLACAKAHGQAHDGEVVLAADTVVVLDSLILGKPSDRSDAARMLRELQGREHTVVTGVALVEAGSSSQRVGVEQTSVRIAPMDHDSVAWYVETGEPMDKAGAYAIQGLGACFVLSIRGNYTNVVGLPLPKVRQLLSELGYDLFDFREGR